MISLLAAALHGTAMAAPVTGTWTKASGTSMVLTNETTASPTWGDGSANNASASSIYSAFPDITLTNPGDKIVLSGSATMVGVTSGAEVFRFGIFNENGTEPPAAGSATSSGTGAGAPSHR